ncbi:tRNA pseudouridine(55) synthase TruB [Pseudoflavonifractor sp. An85]|uniref:tRNA pseudouridine(55) synthase TruB n=1 Tax=Pseudoflavonifractor sp. An85 TaxID=1965661 RepID=UPI000B3A3BA3|nr:tRNA pseudouridine(55) synthase TruB [Pseudoflavonifractor sp. An85]OUN25522.1 tRNA pseudouridine(55) synthase TruB [Pseudoflavonifractor sp. An85]
MPNGIIIIDKPQDWTSMDVCAKLRGVLGERRIGHAGTLDPMATGVLPVFVGRATRAVEFAERGDKEYVAGLKLGMVTDTQDTSGNTLEEHPVAVTEEQVKAVMPQFTGDILQVPPMYSAIKINGKKLYELARKGREVERPARPVTIHALTLEGQIAPDEYTIRVKCSKGTYVRTLCHDIGAALGCGGCMSSLRRTMACGFDLSEAHPLAEVLASDNPGALLRPTDTLFATHPALTLGKRGADRVRHGAQVHQPEAEDGTYRIYGPEEEFLALGRVEQGKLHIVKSFFDPT